MYRERVNEKLPTEYLLHEFDELISCKSLGSYNCCEMVSIYLCQREKEMPDNVYTIFVFETRPNVEKSSERLLKKLKSITDTYSLGIQRKVLDVSEVRSIFELLCNSRDKKEVDIGDGRLETGYLEGVSKVFIQQDSTKEMLLNKVLKNNFINGSYILEFFDCDKKIVNVLNTVQFRKMTDTIFDAIPIDLFSVSDRIGNFVFQFPSTNVRVSYKKDDMERQLTYDVSFDKECESDDQFLVLSEGVFDDSIISFGTRTFKQEGCNTTFEVGDASRFCRTTIIDVKRQLILSRQETSFIRRMTYVLQMGAQYGEQRIIYDETGQVVDIIEPISAENVNIIEQPVIRTRDNRTGKELISHRLGYYPSPSYELYQNDPELYDVDYIYGDILNKSVLPVIIRADYNRDPEESELHHPYSHITLGGYKNCRIPVDRPISPMKFVKFIMEHFYYVPSSQLEFNFEIEGIVAFEEHIAEKDINKSRIIV